MNFSKISRPLFALALVALAALPLVGCASRGGYNQIVVANNLSESEVLKDVNLVGHNSWVPEIKSGQRAVFTPYQLGDGKVTILGNVCDAKTGKPLGMFTEEFYFHGSGRYDSRHWGEQKIEVLIVDHYKPTTKQRGR